ncbi:MAG TPA: formate dehydrogenase accessory protein FdhE [Terriglobales bacterium]|nr:formate dehydrogenase accessory protein FdhE [Terriglobales bacterium]
MTRSPWQRRVERARELAGKHPFAGEILRLYVEIALFQEKLYGELEDTNGRGESLNVSAPVQSPSRMVHLRRFRSFLEMIEKAGLPQVAGVANQLAVRGEENWTDLLNQCWQQAGSSQQDAALLLARAFLQPFAELVRERSSLPGSGAAPSHCPLCRRKPGVAVLRPQGDGGRRSLVCSFCLAEWDFRRIVCAACGEENHSKLPVYVAEDFDYIRVEACDTCNQYIKTIDMTKNGLAEPVVDEIASCPLDLWAQQHGYAKIAVNLMGL